MARGYGNRVLRQYSDIVTRRMNTNLSDSADDTEPTTELDKLAEDLEEPGKQATADGDETVVLESDNTRFEGSPIDMTWQYLSERDVDPELEDVHADSSTETVSVCFEFSRSEIQAILTDTDTPEELRAAVAETLLDGVFDG